MSSTSTASVRVKRSRMARSISVRRSGCSLRSWSRWRSSSRSAMVASRTAVGRSTLGRALLGPAGREDHLLAGAADLGDVRLARVEAAIQAAAGLDADAVVAARRRRVVAADELAGVEVAPEAVVELGRALVGPAAQAAVL